MLKICLCVDYDKIKFLLWDCLSSSPCKHSNEDVKYYFEFLYQIQNVHIIINSSLFQTDQSDITVFKGFVVVL